MKVHNGLRVHRVGAGEVDETRGSGRARRAGHATREAGRELHWIQREAQVGREKWDDERGGSDQSKRSEKRRALSKVAVQDGVLDLERQGAPIKIAVSSPQQQGASRPNQQSDKRHGDPVRVLKGRKEHGKQRADDKHEDEDAAFGD
jgi:hypothetical protein